MMAIDPSAIPGAAALLGTRAAPAPPSSPDVTPAPEPVQPVLTKMAPAPKPVVDPDVGSASCLDCRRLSERIKSARHAGAEWERTSVHLREELANEQAKNATLTPSRPDVTQLGDVALRYEKIAAQDRKTIYHLEQRIAELAEALRKKGGDAPESGPSLVTNYDEMTAAELGVMGA